MNAFMLAFIMCLPGDPKTAECRMMHLEFQNLRACTEMRREVIAEARREGFRVHTICVPIEQESGVAASSQFPR